MPEISFNQRKEILNNFKNVSKVIPSKFHITEKYLKKNKIDFLVHGNDNQNNIKKNKLIIFKRTKGISSSIIRKKASKILKSNNENKNKKK